jgi:hypothetical protein
LEGQVIGGKFVVARRHPTTLLDPIEEPFDPVAFIRGTPRSLSGSIGLMAIHS